MFHCPDFPWQLYIGNQVSCPNDLEAELNQVTDQDFDFMEFPLFHPRFSVSPGVTRNVAPTRSAYALKSDEWGRFAMGRLSPYINPDSPNLLLRSKWEDEMVRQLTWATHIGVYAITIPLITPPGANFIRILNRFLAEGLNHQQVLIEVDLNSWKYWNSLRLHTGPSGVLGINLIITKNLPEEEVLKRWLGEPISNVVLQSEAFNVNRHGYPVLSE